MGSFSFFLLIAPSVFCEDEKEAYQYLNSIRLKAGLPSLDRDNALEKASESHANYLLQNRRVGHYQKPGEINFTGRTPVDRAGFYNYPSVWVIENVSSGHNSYDVSMDRLMGAIYHRMAFLDFQKTDVGLGAARGKTEKWHVYNLGLKPLKECVSNTLQCVSVASKKVLEKAPEMILWPPDGSIKNPVAFYEEEPDPIPGDAVTGYPVSIQLNPLYFNTASLQLFSLYDEKTGEKIQTKTLTRYTDPNRKLTGLQFALFPVKRLQWGRNYIVLAKIRTGSDLRTVHFNFRTKDLLLPQIEIKKNRLNIRMKKASDNLVLYFPPEKTFNYIQRFTWEAPNHFQLNLNWLDSNTVEFSYQGKCGDMISLTLNNQRYHQLQIDCPQ